MPWGRSKTPGAGHEYATSLFWRTRAVHAARAEVRPGYACTLSLTRARPAAPSLHDPTPVRSPAPPPASRAAHPSLWLCHL